MWSSRARRPRRLGRGARRLHRPHRRPRRRKERKRPRHARGADLPTTRRSGLVIMERGPGGGGQPRFIVLFIDGRCLLVQDKVLVEGS